MIVLIKQYIFIWGGGWHGCQRAHSPAAGAPGSTPGPALQFP